MSTEPDARIIIDKLLREADWVMPGEDQPPNVTTEIKNDAGEADYVLLDSDGFPLCAVEAKRSTRSPLVGKEQARGYAESLRCRFILLSNSLSHYLWDLEQGSPFVIDKFPSQKQLEMRKNGFNPPINEHEDIHDDYVTLTQYPNYSKDPDYLDDNRKQDFINKNKLKFLRDYQLAAVHAVQDSIKAAGGAATREMHGELANLRRRSLRLTRRDVDSVRCLLSHCGVGQVDAPQEADHICASLVARGDCWGCLSEDTDMFALGCPRVLKTLSLVQGTLTLCDWDGARRGLGISQDEFRILCAAAGTDYGPGVSCLDLEGAWRAWTEWNKSPGGEPLTTRLADSEEGAAELSVAAAALRPATSLPPIQQGAQNVARTRSYLSRFGIVFCPPD